MAGEGVSLCIVMTAVRICMAQVEKAEAVPGEEKTQTL